MPPAGHDGQRLRQDFLLLYDGSNGPGHDVASAACRERHGKLDGLFGERWCCGAGVSNRDCQRQADTDHDSSCNGLHRNSPFSADNFTTKARNAAKPQPNRSDSPKSAKGAKD
jgi:hypothetical protein